MRSKVVIGGTILALIALAAVGLSQDEERPLSPEPGVAEEKVDESEIESLVKKLGDPDFDVRAQAEKEIVALGEKAVPFLEKAAKDHPDTHVRFEAQRLLSRIRKEAELHEKDPVRERARDLRGRIEEHRRWIEEMLRRFEERGQLFESDLEELFEGTLRSSSRSVKGVVTKDGERLEYERKADGSVTVTRTRDGETKTWEAESLEALKESAPEAYELVEPYLGGGSFLDLGPDLFRFRRQFPPVVSPLVPDPGKIVPPGGFRLGIWVGDVSEALRVHLKLAEHEGILVEDVVPGSLASKMGVERLDVIRAVNGEAVGSAPDILRVLAKVEEGGQVELTVIRKGDPLKLLGNR
jgi:hypothetical protein